MECSSVRHLIEAYCDDELDVASAARLVAHLEECSSCARQVRETEERTASLRRMRPVDSCPPALKERVLSRVAFPGPPGSPGRRAPRLLAFVGVAAVAATVAVVAVRSREAPRHLPGAFAGGGVVRELTGEVFCLRCALGELFPGMPLLDSKHLPVLRTDEGEIVTILDNELAERKLAFRGCAGRRVTVTARYLPAQALAEVLEVFPAGPPPGERSASVTGHAGPSPEPPRAIAAAPPAR